MADEPVTQDKIDDELVAWVVGTVEPWEDYRDQNYKDDWEEYYQQWKGIWLDSSKTRDSERSKFISPALAQAIEMAVSEMEEATFSRKYWFDVDDDLADQQKADREIIRDRLLEDFKLAKVPKSISEIYLNGAIYGTGIGKVVVSEITEISDVEGTERVEVSLEPISPKEFANDPTARNVNEGLGCAHTPVKSKVDIQTKIDEGIYNDIELGSFADDEDTTAMGEVSNPISGERVEILEYHGLVPSRFLLEIDEITADLASEESTDMTEAIVTIANREGLLKAVANPFTKRDRSIIAYQHDTVPNRFHGRGVAEKGIQSQRALNAELRARQDGLALTIHPMMGVDATRVPRGFKPQIAPGKTLLSNGDPATAFRPMHFGDMGSHTYSEAGELERMMQMATGSMDSATGSNVNARNNTASGMSMIGAGAIKRSKRTMRNIEEDFLIPLINKASWRYQQFDPERYPEADYKLLPFSTMGIIAREVEQGQIAQVIQSVPEGPAKGILLMAFLDNITLQSKTKVEQALQLQFNPQPDPVQQEIQQLQLQAARFDVMQKGRDIGKTEAEIEKIYADIADNARQTDINAYNSIDNTENQELDRQAFSNKGEQ